MADAGLIGEASIDWDHLDADDHENLEKLTARKTRQREQRRPADQELVEVGLDNKAMLDPDAIQAVFKKLNAADEAEAAEAARRDLGG